jgi:hypothetical protein
MFPSQSNISQVAPASVRAVDAAWFGASEGWLQEIGDHFGPWGYIGYLIGHMVYIYYKYNICDGIMMGL